MWSPKVKASSPRTQLYRKDELDVNRCWDKNFIFRAGLWLYPGPHRGSNPLAQGCWYLGGGHTSNPAPGFTPLAAGLCEPARTRDLFTCAQKHLCLRMEAISWDWSPGSQALLIGLVKCCGERASPGQA